MPPHSFTEEAGHWRDVGFGAMAYCCLTQIKIASEKPGYWHSCVFRQEPLSIVPDIVPFQNNHLGIPLPCMVYY
jgi:hypothetical protein